MKVGGGKNYEGLSIQKRVHFLYFLLQKVQILTIFNYWKWKSVEDFFYHIFEHHKIIFFLQNIHQYCNKYILSIYAHVKPVEPFN